MSMLSGSSFNTTKVEKLLNKNLLKADIMSSNERLIHPQSRLRAQVGKLASFLNNHPFILSIAGCIELLWVFAFLVELFSLNFHITTMIEDDKPLRIIKYVRWTETALASLYVVTGCWLISSFLELFYTPE